MKFLVISVLWDNMVNHSLKQPWLVNYDDLKNNENDF